MPTSHRRQAHKDALPPLTPHQREALYGMLLSDAHARQRADCHAALIEFRQSERQAPLVDHLFALFRDWTWLAQPRHYEESLGTKVHGKAAFETFTHPALTTFHRAFYRPRAGGGWVKGIPERVDDWLTPRVLAYQVMGDGSLNRGARLMLHTEGFARDDVVRYAAALHDRYGLQPVLSPDRRSTITYWRIRFPAGDLPVLQGLLLPYLLPTFRYKVGR